MTGRVPRVVQLPGNDVLADARVLKYLATTAALGLESIGVGVVRRGDSRELAIGGSRVLITEVPPPPVAAIRSRSPQVQQLAVVFRPGYRTTAEHEAARAQVIRWARRIRRSRGARRVVGEAALLVPRVFARLAAHRLRLAPGTEMVGVADADVQRDLEIARFRAQPSLTPWRKELPVITEDEKVLGALLDELEPDLVHVHDVFMLGVAAGAVRRAARRGRRVRLVYDAHEYIPGLAFIPSRTVGAYCALEREFVGAADRIVTVSEPLADLLAADHSPVERPLVVLNAPAIAEPPEGFTDLRAHLGLDDDVPLMVYGGGVNTARGVQTAVAALPQLPGVHLALVTNRRNYVVEGLFQQAEQLGVADRFHLAPYVPADLVTHYFARVDVGLSTLLHAPNHDVAVTNKFCEYLNAGVPIVTSDTPAQADLVTELDLGAVYPAGDAEGLAAAVRAVLADRERLHRRIVDDAELRHRFSWRAQAEKLRDLYADLLDGLPEQAWEEDALDITDVADRTQP